MKLEHLWLVVKIVIIFLLQVWVFNNLYLFRYATPYPYIVTLLFFPINASKIATTLYGGVFGLLLDIVSGMPGLHTASFTLVGFLRNYLLVPFIDPDMETARALSSRKHLGRVLLLLLELTLIHHAFFFGLEAIQGIHITYFLLRFATSFLFTYLLSVIFLLLFGGGRSEVA